MKADFYNGKGYNLESKGCNQGCNLNDSLAEKSNLLQSNKLAEKSIWISRKEGCNLLGISHPAIFKHIKNGHFVTRRVKMNGGLGYEIELNSILKWLEKRGKIEKKLEILKAFAPAREVLRKTTRTRRKVLRKPRLQGSIWSGFTGNISEHRFVKRCRQRMIL